MRAVLSYWWRCAAATPTVVIQSRDLRRWFFSPASRLGPRSAVPSRSGAPRSALSSGSASAGSALASIPRRGVAGVSRAPAAGRGGACSVLGSSAADPPETAALAARRGRGDASPIAGLEPLVAPLPLPVPCASAVDLAGSFVAPGDRRGRPGGRAVVGDTLAAGLRVGRAAAEGTEGGLVRGRSAVASAEVWRRGAAAVASGSAGLGSGADVAGRRPAVASRGAAGSACAGAPARAVARRDVGRPRGTGAAGVVSASARATELEAVRSAGFVRFTAAGAPGAVGLDVAAAFAVTVPGPEGRLRVSGAGSTCGEDPGTTAFGVTGRARFMPLVISGTADGAGSAGAAAFGGTVRGRTGRCVVPCPAAPGVVGASVCTTGGLVTETLLVRGPSLGPRGINATGRTFPDATSGAGAGRAARRLRLGFDGTRGVVGVGSSRSLLAARAMSDASGSRPGPISPSGSSDCRIEAGVSAGIGDGLRALTCVGDLSPSRLGVAASAGRPPDSGPVVTNASSEPARIAAPMGSTVGPPSMRRAATSGVGHAAGAGSAVAACHSSTAARARAGRSCASAAAARPRAERGCVSAAAARARAGRGALPATGRARTGRDSPSAVAARARAGRCRAASADRCTAATRGRQRRSLRRSPSWRAISTMTATSPAANSPWTARRGFQAPK